MVRSVPESVSARMQPDPPWRRPGRARQEREVAMTEKLASGSRAGTTLRTGINYWAVAVAAAATLVVSAVWYTVFGNAWLTLRRWRSQARCFMSSTHWACTPSMSVTRSWRRSP
jgi:hypothetical protein